MDSSGNIYGSDYSGDAIYKIDPNGNATTFASGLDAPNGLAFVSNGNLYVCDNTGNAIYILDSQGNFLDTIQISNPSGIIKMPTSDSLWLTTYNPSALYKLAPDNSLTQVHVGGVLNGPVGFCYDNNNDLFVGNFNNRAVYKVYDDTLIFWIQIPSGGIGSSLGFITYAQGGIWGTTFGSNKIYKVSSEYPDSVILSIGSGQGTMDGQADQALFDQPNGIYASHTGDSILISDYGTGNIRILSGAHLDDKEITDPEIDFEIAPNPAELKFILNFTKSLNQASINIVDIYGKTIYENENLSGLNHSIDCDQWAKGIYFINIQVGQRSLRKRLIVGR